jgi:DNA-binding transcriptional ArsR family regulator
MPVRRVVLTPQIAMRPWNIVRAYPNFLFICYPVASDCLAQEDSGPPDHLLRLHRALGDGRRLEILKLLAGSDTSLDELSRKLGIAKSSVLYHMGLLRSAGLVRIESDYRSRYGLRWETAAAAGSALRQFLGDPPS